MSDFVNVSVTFGVVISIPKKEKMKPAELEATISDLISRETEWTGEPQSPKGCIVTMNPRHYKILNGGEHQVLEQAPEAEEEPKSPPIEYIPIVKAVRKGEDTKLIKSSVKIATALESKTGYTLLIQPEAGGIKFSSIELLVGQMVRFPDKGGDLMKARVGGASDKS